MKLGRTDKQDTPLIPVTFSGRAVVWRLLTDPIWASGHAAALTGRTHERFRPAVSLLPRPLNPRAVHTWYYFASGAIFGRWNRSSGLSHPLNCGGRFSANAARDSMRSLLAP